MHVFVQVFLVLVKENKEAKGDIYVFETHITLKRLLNEPDMESYSHFLIDSIDFLCDISFFLYVLTVRNHRL